jgi:hypothetical protein
MTSTAYLAVTDRAQRESLRASTSPDPSVRTIGASRPSAVRALLARSITMTALAIERRVRARRRRLDSQAPGPSLALWRQRQAARARHEHHLAQAGAARALFSIR